MAQTKFKTRIITGGILLLAIVAVIVGSHNRNNEKGRLGLPVGNGTPAISLGERHGLILASDGSLWSWGSDFLGWQVLGLGNFTNHTTSLRRIGHETNWVRISAGMSHSLAIRSDGTLWTWGESVEVRNKRPQQISTPIAAAPGHDWKQAAAGGIHSVALKNDGTLWAWGNNWSGALGIVSSNGSSVPVQVGTTTNWTKVWAGILETVAMQSDGSLWYWGENPNPGIDQKVGQIFTPTRVSPDTNWVDVGFGVNTVFAIKSDGSLWAWGRQAHVYTGVNDQALDALPMRVGTNSDWREISATMGWWCQGLIKKDGSLWLMDASDGKPNGPRSPYKPIRYRQIPFPSDYVAYAGGAVHGAAPGVHGPLAVALTRNGEVWTWGMILGDPPTLESDLANLGVKFANTLHSKVSPADPDPIFRDKPWQLRNIDPNAPAK